MQKTRWILIISLFVIAIIGGSAMAQQTSKTKAKASKLKNSLKSVESDKKAVQNQLKKTKREANLVLADIEKVDNSMDRLQSSIDKSERREISLTKERNQLAKDLIKAEKTLVTQTEWVRKRMRGMFMESKGTVLGTLMSSDSLGDLASRKVVFDKIAEKDKATFDEYNRVCIEVREQKKRRETMIREINDLQRLKINEKREFAIQREKKKELLDEIRGRQEDLEMEFAALDAESNKIESELAKIAALSMSSGGPKFGGKFIKPTTGRVTSGFGYRRHPILGRSKMHTGIDFGAPSGTPVWASAAGTVVSAGYRGGYGNTIIVDHGGGVATLYGHLSRISVSSGQRVTQGQRIGNVGSTGMSTGPHLHFEIRINGKPVNPAGRV